LQGALGVSSQGFGSRDQKPRLPSPPARHTRFDRPPTRQASGWREGHPSGRSDTNRLTWRGRSPRLEQLQRFRGQFHLETHDTGSSRARRRASPRGRDIAPAESWPSKIPPFAVQRACTPASGPAEEELENGLKSLDRASSTRAPTCCLWGRPRRAALQQCPLQQASRDPHCCGGWKVPAKGFREHHHEDLSKKGDNLAPSYGSVASFSWVIGRVSFLWFCKVGLFSLCFVVLGPSVCFV